MRSRVRAEPYLRLALWKLPLVLEALIVQGWANAERRAEVLALRHQLRVLEWRADPIGSDAIASYLSRSVGS